MRTTVTLADDVAAGIARIRQERSIGLSEAVNELVRVGLLAQEPRPTFTQATRAMGLHIDVADVHDALDTLEGPDRR